MTEVHVHEDVLKANDTFAEDNRRDFEAAKVSVVNLMSSPGAGKTSLLERVLPTLDVRAGVLEGDVQSSIDADRISSVGVPVSLVNTETTFAGECHLDARMVRSGLGDLSLENLDLLVIENVGNLVCPAEFTVGEHRRAMVFSVTEGEEKPLKYPLMFRSCEVVFINKADLLPHLDFDMDLFRDNLHDVHPDIEYHLMSARTGEGSEAFASWLTATPAR
jgi:hydrogenase nickel incorporation protein HypB